MGFPQGDWEDIKKMPEHITFTKVKYNFTRLYTKIKSGFPTARLHPVQLAKIFGKT